jgi:hypothetical protein
VRTALFASALLNVYVLGAMLVFALVSYPGFGHVDRASFPALYKSFNQTIGFAVVPFEFLAFLVPLSLYFFRPASLTPVHAVTALGVVYFAITFAWHLPQHRPLAAGDNTALSALMLSQWMRTVLQVVRAGLLTWLAVA